MIRFLEDCRKELLLGGVAEGSGAFALIKSRYASRVAHLKEASEQVSQELHFLFAFAEESFGEGNEMLILVTELTVNTSSSQFIATFGSPDYKRHNEEMMLSERSNDLKEQIGQLQLD